MCHVVEGWGALCRVRWTYRHGVGYVGAGLGGSCRIRWGGLHKGGVHYMGWSGL